MSAFDLTGHVAIITGANHGIGAAAARRFAEESADLFHVAAPENVSEVIAFLCSAAATLITANRIQIAVTDPGALSPPDMTGDEGRPAR